MLARSAEGLYWLGRHLERTENGCRLLGEQMTTLVDRPVQQIDFGWRRIYGALGRRPPGPAIAVLENDDDYALADSYTLADDVTFERSNPDAIRNCFAQGRENARQMRHCISAEMWTCLNRAWLRFRERRIEDIWQTAPESFYADLAQELGTFAGVTETTLYRDDGWRFLWLGRLIERAQFTVALLTAQMAAVRPDEGHVDGEWSSLLRICQASDAYKRCHGVGVRPDRALALLVGDAQLPRSLGRTLHEVADKLGALAAGPGSTDEARLSAGNLAADIHRQWRDTADTADWDGPLRRMDGECRQLHDLVMAAHVAYDPDGAPVR